MLRIILFLATNLAVILVASITLSILGVGSYFSQQGLDFGNLLIFCLVFGMAGSAVSLLLSKWMAKRGMNVQVIESPHNASEQWLVSTVQELADKAGIGMPEVGVFNSHQPNAFATGWNRNDALVAVSTGLLQRMSKDEVKAVLGHEIGHVANGDMVTLALIQGVINAFVMFFARIIGNFVDKAILKNENGPGIGFFIATFVSEIVLGILASFIVAWFSRRREYRADIAGADLVSPVAMINALARLQESYDQPSELNGELVAFGIAGEGKLAALAASHPPLTDRINALRQRYSV
ncbi:MULTISPECIES: protease HtpX [unclassified Oceanobacter]|jgi:heat shock protein HtpX|uniref:protease HtpX n=2 Tax=Gammaproteobacteria TaxID=1236 RepID=UPI0026E37F71|nr:MULTISPECIES: protease HtpX [unclassified Oceanobacter]MDO6680714.1 protease HtpX [Oceanobacter sp. 5_MG-2023]MDP2504483.1 protease HtpX [Oceanobacter sp. 3_MG-2023]MDP2547063.1 protease HtpX [Oceanobacter sp. 4_MG-2023]MDP2607887.1 protease HtpX [Oceanobacter sp. 1_MG-2023]MDP2610929.1 protease HtpX [Oceanobacter sp. 2_MG-2023]